MLSDRVYRALLHAFPAGFRESFEAEMCEDFAELRQRRGSLHAWPRALIDIAAAAPAAHVSALSADLRDAVRSMRAAPGIVLAAMLTLGIGVGANTAIYSLADALLFRPLPVPHAERLVTIGRGDNTGEPASYADYTDLRDRNRSFSSLAAFEPVSVRLDDGSREDRVMCEIVSGNYFATLALSPVIGRLIGDEDDVTVGAHPVAVISRRMWTRRFLSDPQILGRDVRINGHHFTIIGIAPEDFRGSAIPLTVELWVPLAMYREAFPALPDRNQNRTSRWLALMGRLKDDTGVELALADVNRVELEIQQENPQLVQGDEHRRQERRLSLSPARGALVQRRMMGLASLLMMVITGLVLAIACVNVANLLLAHGATRRRELAIRLALGASRRRIVRQLLAETLLLSLLGAAAGFGFAWLALRALGDLQTPVAGPWQWSAHAELDLRALAYAGAVAVLTGFIFGLGPALRSTRLDVCESIKQSSVTQGGGRAGNRFRRALVIGQIALSACLLISAGLLVRTLQNLYRTSPGFETRRQIVADVDFSGVAYDQSRQNHFLEEAMSRIGALPGVDRVSLTADFMPLNLSPNRIAAKTRGARTDTSFALVDPAFLPLVGIPLVAGAPFGPREQRVIVNRILAKRLWPGQNAVGQQIRIGPADGVPFEVAGVAREAKYFSLAEDSLPFIYLPVQNDQARSVTGFHPRLFVKTSVNPESLLKPVREIFAQLDPTVEVRGVNPLRERVDFALWPTRLEVRFLGAFSLLGLILAAAGLYGVMSYTVERWTHEIGLRLAVGATASEVIRLVLRRAMRMAAVGLAAGLLLGAVMGRSLRGLLAGVSSVDPFTYSAVALLLLAVALIASLGPALRASRVDPVTALRYE